MAKTKLSHQRLWQLRKQEEGRCQRCGKPKDTVYRDNVYCKACMKRVCDATMSRYYDRKARGLCPVCGKRKPAKNKVLCRKCVQSAQSRVQGKT